MRGNQAFPMFPVTMDSFIVAAVMLIANVGTVYFSFSFLYPYSVIFSNDNGISAYLLRLYGNCFCFLGTDRWRTYEKETRQYFKNTVNI